MFVDKVQGERTSYGYPETPDDVGGEFPPIGEESESSSDESSSDESESTEKPMRQQMGGVCDPVGAYDAMFACENDGEPTQTFINVHEITDRGGGFINLYATRANPLPLLQFNITLQLMPGEKNVYIGAASFLNYHPGPPTESNFPPPHLPALIPIRVEFDKDCNYWMYWLTQKPACVLGTVCYTPPGHPCRVTGTRQEGGRRLAIDDASAVDEGEQGDTNTAVVIEKENDRELMKNRKFLGDYVAEFKCFSGETEHDVFEEKHTIYEMPASINGFYGLERTREDGYTALEKLSINELHKTLFHSFTQNNTDYNLNENDPAWMSDQLMPLVTMDIQFEDREYERYSAVMVGQRPGIGRDDEDLGAHVCKVRAAKEGTSLPDWVGEEDMGCNPAGRYDVTVDCRRYLAPVGVFPEDHRIVDLGYGFYKISFLHFTQDLPQGGAEGPNNQFIMDTLLVEDPTKPGFLTGTTYARNDYYTRAWSTVDFPLYITVQMQTVDDDGDGKCDTWSATLQGYRPGPIPFDGDVMHYCGFEASTIHVGAVVDESCMDGASDCQGGCYEGQYDYVGLCVAGEGLENTPNFVREVLMPNPVVMDSTCEELGFTVQLEGGSCPDAFYGMNDVCIFTNDESGEWIQEKVPGFFDNTINPYVDYFEFPWGQYWLNDNPQCLYTENSPGAPSIPTNCAIAGRYDCPIERCVNGTEILIEGGDYTQTMLIHETGLGYFDMEVIDNPFGVSWSAIMYQKPWDKLTLTGAMYRTSNHESTYENPDHQLLEARFDPVMSGCTTFQMILRGYTSVPREWESPYHMCDFVCNRVRNFGSILGDNPNSMTPY
eukprot:CAMPEP_0197466134 /NCGR_PEP_ID=MMETSP1175-20131217/64895_1 /TAXON_ID=1003142 /ORGANISM="Triceratium dubium, Strain CCMP147" /LENGTH=829 /DNA_ID=CAMNT_0043002163 /DNA_START=1 /DNA_END=2490 /DNA_ORIENTATION=-